MLSSQQIKNFQKLYFEHFGKEINEHQATDIGSQLIRLVGSIYKH